MIRLRSLVIAICVLTFLVGGSLVPLGLADGGPNHRVRNLNFGVSGGNVNDSTRRFCCSGTLGALLIGSNGKQYILSNNHVLGRSDDAAVGEDISQPGLIDSNCNVSTVVADFTTGVPLGQNVDAAIAELRLGEMDPTGEVEDIGIPSSTIANPAVGMAVEKSGRTTGHTNGTISSINTSVNVQYQRGCGQGKKFVVSYIQQVVINSSTFSAGGDSGSVIFETNSNSPVALLYAGSSTSTIGNPIGEVLTKLSTRLGATLSFVGTPGGSSISSSLGTGEVVPFIRGGGMQRKQLPEQAAARASAVLDRHRANLMFMDGVIGAGVGLASDDDDETAAIVIYVDRTGKGRPVVASSIEGVPVRMIMTDPFIAY